MRRILTLVSVAALGLAACGSEDDWADEPSPPVTTEAAGAAEEPAEEPVEEPAAEPAPEPAEEPAVEPATVVVTTTVLGDIVSAVVGDLAEVEVIMPIGADPHDFAPSVRQAESMEDADLLVVNGAGFEEGMLGTIDAVADGGTPVFAFADSMELLAGGHDHDHGDDGHDHGDEDKDDGHDHGDDDHDHGDEDKDDGHDHGDEDKDDGHDHEHAGGFDPHLWNDPARMIDGVRGLGDALGAIEGIDAEALASQVDAYVAELEQLDGEIEELLAPIADDQRVLVTNHESFAYFADRYRFEVVGTVIPSLTTSAETSIRALEGLAGVITERGIPAIFAETTQSTELAEALADEVGGDVQVVALFSESLGEPGSGAETYIDMMRVNAELIADALT